MGPPSSPSAESLCLAPGGGCLGGPSGGCPGKQVRRPATRVVFTLTPSLWTVQCSSGLVLHWARPLRGEAHRTALRLRAYPRPCAALEWTKSSLT